MSRILAVVLMLVPMMISAQEWTRIGVMKGAPGMQAVGSDTVQFMVSYGVLYRQGADRFWREQARVSNVREMRAWGDTVVLIGDQYHWSSNGGKEWSTAPIESRWKIMPNRSWVAFVEDRGNSTARVIVKDVFSGQQSYMDYTIDNDFPGGWIVERDHIVVLSGRPTRGDYYDLIIIKVPSVSSDSWQMERTTTYSSPTSVASGGFVFEPGSDWVAVLLDRRDTLNRAHYTTIPAVLSDLCTVEDTWYQLYARQSLVSYRYTPERTWDTVGPIDLPLDTRVVGVQGQELILASYSTNAGPFRFNVHDLSLRVDADGLTSSGVILTDGRYVATYDHSQFGQSRFALVRERLKAPQVIIDTVVNGRIRDVAFVGDVFWFITDSVYSYDPATRTLTNEQVPGIENSYRWYVAELPGGVGISTVGRVLYRANGSSTWTVLAEVPLVTADLPFIGTDDGFLLVSPEPEPDLANIPYYAHRFTMDGTQIGDSVLIGRRYPRRDYYTLGFQRHGSNIYFGTYENVNAVSTDQGATWTELTSPLSERRLTPTSSAVWWATDTLLHFSSDLMQHDYAYGVPSIGITGERVGLCLDFNCYTNTVYGLSYIKRPTVGVDENTDRPSRGTSNATTAQLINVLGESIGTLPIVDGQLAPFDPTTLPMQVLWAVWGERVVRVR